MLANLLVAAAEVLGVGVVLYVMAFCAAARRSDDESEAWAKKRRALLAVNKQ